MSKIVISDLSLPESLTSLSQQEQKQIIGGNYTTSAGGGSVGEKVCAVCSNRP